MTDYTPYIIIGSAAATAAIVALWPSKLPSRISISEKAVITKYSYSTEIKTDVGTKKYYPFQQIVKKLEYKLSNTDKKQKLLQHDPLLNMLYG